MDRQTRQIADYAASLSLDDVPKQIRHDLKRRLIDSLACALAAHSTEPVLAARALASTATGNPPAHLILTGEPTTLDLAAYAGALAVRYWDWNDTYLHGGHPSDTVSGVLSTAESVNSSGANTLCALTIAYEVFCALSDAPHMLGTSAAGRIAIASAAACGRLLGLDRDGIANAVSLAAASVISRGVRGHGQLSMWRAGQSAHGARGGAQAAVAALHGMAGPHEPFALLDANADLPSIGGRAGGSHLKAHAAEYHAQAAIGAALAVRARLDGSVVDGVTVHTYAHAVRGIGSHPAMWEAADVDTALHSMPYLVSVALLDGAAGPSQFTAQRLASPDVRRLIDRTHVAEDPAMTAAYPGRIGSRVAVITSDGRHFVEECVQPLGHTANPMSDAQIEAKLLANASPLFDERQAREIVDCCWDLDRCADVGWLFGTA